MQTFRRIRRSIAALLLVLYLPACYHYVTPKGMTPQEYIAAKHPGQVRLTLTDSSRLDLFRPAVSGDSLAGFLVVPKGLGYEEGGRVSVPLYAVFRIEVHKKDAAAEAALMVIVGAAFFGAVIGVALSESVEGLHM